MKSIRLWKFSAITFMLLFAILALFAVVYYNQHKDNQYTQTEMDNVKQEILTLEERLELEQINANKIKTQLDNQILQNEEKTNDYNLLNEEYQQALERIAKLENLVETGEWNMEISLTYDVEIFYHYPDDVGLVGISINNIESTTIQVDAVIENYVTEDKQLVFDVSIPENYVTEFTYYGWKLLLPDDYNYSYKRNNETNIITFTVKSETATLELESITSTLQVIKTATSKFLQLIDTGYEIYVPVGYIYTKQANVVDLANLEEQYIVGTIYNSDSSLLTEQYIEFDITIPENRLQSYSTSSISYQGINNGFDINKTKITESTYKFVVTPTTAISWEEFRIALCFQIS